LNPLSKESEDALENYKRAIRPDPKPAVPSNNRVHQRKSSHKTQLPIGFKRSE